MLGDDVKTERAYNIKNDSVLISLVRDAENGFEKHFNRIPRWIAAAPGRVNLIGEHIDYNNGFVLPMAIQRYTIIAADFHPEIKNNGGERAVCIYSGTLGEMEKIYLNGKKIPRSFNWTDYIRGVLAGFQRLGIELKPLNIFISGNVPVGSGLSSSAALEVATATLIEAISGFNLNYMDKIVLCQKAEHEYTGVPCGIMDQFCSVMGRKDSIILLDCQSMESELIPFEDPDITVMLVNSNVSHKHSTNEYANRRAQCEEAAGILGVSSLREARRENLEASRTKLEPLLYKRARHVITEIERTKEAASAIKEENWNYIGSLMYESHVSMRDDYEVSCPEMDILVNIASKISNEHRGIIGSRMTGGGFGGCAVCLVQTEAIPAIKQEINNQYHKQTGIEPEFFISRPAQGSLIVKE